MSQPIRVLRLRLLFWRMLTWIQLTRHGPSLALARFHLAVTSHLASAQDSLYSAESLLRTPRLLYLIILPRRVGKLSYCLWTKTS